MVSVRRRPGKPTLHDQGIFVGTRRRARQRGGFSVRVLDAASARWQSALRRGDAGATILCFKVWCWRGLAGAAGWRASRCPDFQRLSNRFVSGRAQRAWSPRHVGRGRYKSTYFRNPSENHVNPGTGNYTHIRINFSIACAGCEIQLRCCMPSGRRRLSHCVSICAVVRKWRVALS